MNGLLEVILAVAAMLLVADLMKENFHKNLTIGQDIGVRFGDYVVNREVITLGETSVTVRDAQMQNLVEVPLTDVYMPDKYSVKNEVISNDEH